MGVRYFTRVSLLSVVCELTGLDNAMIKNIMTAEIIFIFLVFVMVVLINTD